MEGEGMGRYYDHVTLRRSRLSKYPTLSFSVWDRHHSADEGKRIKEISLHHPQVRVKLVHLKPALCLQRRSGSSVESNVFFPSLS